MLKLKLHTCLLLFSLLAINNSLIASNDYKTDLLARMAASMNITSQLSSLANGEYYKQFTYQGQPVTVIVRNNSIEHIGHSLFTPYQRSLLKAPICNFIERFSLEIAVPLEREKSIEKHIAESGVSFDKGTFSSFCHLFNDTTYQVSIENKDDKNYLVQWQKNNQTYCAIKFPIDYDLLNGSEMLENERRLAGEILKTSAACSNSVAATPDELSATWQKNYFIQQGQSYYSNELNTNKYFEQDDTGGYNLVYTSKYPLESLANLLTSSAIDNQFVMDIRLKKYGLTEDAISVPLNSWINFCLNTGCTPYVGVINYDGNFATCELLMRNADLGYNHVMKLTFDITQLEDRKGIIEARLNSYVPSSKIKYLFDELRQ